MDVTATLPDHGAIVGAVMEGFVLAALVEIQAGVVPPYPTMVPGIKFVEEPVPSENWQLPHQVVAAGGGDCEDYAFWQAAGHRATGADPGATTVLIQVGPNKLHCVVMRSNGTTEDPAMLVKQREAGEGQYRRRSGWRTGATITVTDHRGKGGPTRQQAPAPPADAPATTRPVNPVIRAITDAAVKNGGHISVTLDPRDAAAPGSYLSNLGVRAEDINALMHDPSVLLAPERVLLVNAAQGRPVPGQGRPTSRTVPDENDPNLMWADDGAGGGYIYRASPGQDPALDPGNPASPYYDPNMDPYAYGQYGYGFGGDPYSGGGYAGWYSSAYDAPTTYQDLMSRYGPDEMLGLDGSEMIQATMYGPVDDEEAAALGLGVDDSSDDAVDAAVDANVDDGGADGGAE